MDLKVGLLRYLYNYVNSNTTEYVYIYLFNNLFTGVLILFKIA